MTALVRNLEAFGLRCVYSGDIRTGHDALALNSYRAVDAIITSLPKLPSVFQLQRPMLLRATIFDCRSQLFEYVLPSQPQTCLTTFTAVQA